MLSSPMLTEEQKAVLCELQDNEAFNVSQSQTEPKHFSLDFITEVLLLPEYS